MFRIGQRVVYVGCEDRLRGKIWTVRRFKNHCCEDDVLYDLGMPNSPDFRPGTICRSCGFNISDTTVWKKGSVLRPLDEDYAEGVLSKIKEGIDEIEEMRETIKTKENV